MASAPYAVPKAKGKGWPNTPATMEEVAARLRAAFDKVASNKGAPGPDGCSIEAVRDQLDEVLPALAEVLIEGSYTPGDIRRVFIPKTGGRRALGIPDVIDRMIQEAIRQVIEPLYEPTFHPSSHGFRPNRSCHTAITEATRYVAEGRNVVVDLDLDSFFDRVNRQRLMARLSLKIEDRRLLVLIGRMLQARVVMPNGVVVSTEEGLPQGGPLSPLLSNIVLDELDQELARRGHRFVRYADDCNIYVSSERAGQRTMASIKSFIERRLRLKVNEAKSAVAKPEERHFVGFRLREDPLTGEVEVLLSMRSKKRIDAKIRELTPRNWGNSLRACIHGINAYLAGWIGFFGICTKGELRTLHNLDAHIRRRLRALQLKHWKRARTIIRKLIGLGCDPSLARRQVYGGRKRHWALSRTYAVQSGLRNSYFEERGLTSLEEMWIQRHRPSAAPDRQLLLPLG